MSLEEITISTKEELFSLIHEYENKGFYFRGENRRHKNKKHELTFCLPPYFRKEWNELNINDHGDNNNEWFQKKLQELGIGLPYYIAKSDSDENTINSVFFNSQELRFRIWGEDKLEALMKHYQPDLKVLKCLLSQTDIELIGNFEDLTVDFFSRYLDITSDLFVALHFACSSYHFIPTNNEPENTDSGFLFIYDLQDIENAEYLRLVFHQSYSYFCKSGNNFYFQSFDRITHQRGAFLAPKRNEKGVLEFRDFEKEIQKTYLHKKIIIEKKLKRELYEMFGGEKGLNYYFPKIDCMVWKDHNETYDIYEKLKGITLF